VRGARKRETFPLDKALDCRAFGYPALTETVTYLTSHEVDDDSSQREPWVS